MTSTRFTGSPDGSAARSTSTRSATSPSPKSCVSPRGRCRARALRPRPTGRPQHGGGRRRTPGFAGRPGLARAAAVRVGAGRRRRRATTVGDRSRRLDPGCAGGPDHRRGRHVRGTDRRRSRHPGAVRCQRCRPGQEHDRATRREPASRHAARADRVRGPPRRPHRPARPHVVRVDRRRGCPRATPGRGGVRADARPRSLQGGQRHPRPSRRRRPAGAVRATACRRCSAPGDVLARLAGDEFAILCRRRDHESAIEFARTLRSSRQQAGRRSTGSRSSSP